MKKCVFFFIAVVLSSSVVGCAKPTITNKSESACDMLGIQCES